MWSDMFFRLANNGEYYPIEPSVSQEVIDITPKDVGLIYWDYFHVDKETYDKMFNAHQLFKNEVWFAGGAWTWMGFTPGNAFTLESMIPAMQSAKEHGIENIILTLWGMMEKSVHIIRYCLRCLRYAKFMTGKPLWIG